ncbi:hypothetical protein ACOSQ4_004815 [Xanthoceras sorbifolium]
MPPRRRTRGQESRADTPPPPPPQPINEQVVNLLEAVMRMSATQTVHVKDKNERLRDFCRIFDAQFDGRQDPIAADRWLKAIRRAFSQVDTPSEFWVDFPVYRLTVFEGLFRDNYFNAGHRRMLADMFENIEQGGMTVNEYYTRFMELSQFQSSRGGASGSHSDSASFQGQPMHHPSHASSPAFASPDPQRQYVPQYQHQYRAPTLGFGQNVPQNFQVPQASGSRGTSSYNMGSNASGGRSGKGRGKGRGTGQAYAATAEEECDHSGYETAKSNFEDLIWWKEKTGNLW